MYKEIIKLHRMLDDAGISYTFKPYADGYQLLYAHDDNLFCSAIEHKYSYGHEKDLIEIMGLLTEEEAAYDDVVGYLTAEDVFARIQAVEYQFEGGEENV